MSRDWKTGSGRFEVLPSKGKIPEEGFEPSRPYGHYDLNVARLPVPPLWWMDKVVSQQTDVDITAGLQRILPTQFPASPNGIHVDTALCARRGAGIMQRWPYLVKPPETGPTIAQKISAIVAKSKRKTSKMSPFRSRRTRCCSEALPDMWRVAPIG